MNSAEAVWNELAQIAAGQRYAESIALRHFRRRRTLYDRQQPSVAATPPPDPFVAATLAQRRARFQRYYVEHLSVGQSFDSFVFDNYLNYLFDKFPAAYRRQLKQLESRVSALPAEWRAMPDVAALHAGIAFRLYPDLPGISVDILIANVRAAMRLANCDAAELGRLGQFLVRFGTACPNPLAIRAFQCAAAVFERHPAGNAAWSVLVRRLLRDRERLSGCECAPELLID